jgi:hypothetical protein
MLNFFDRPPDGTGTLATKPATRDNPPEVKNSASQSAPLPVPEVVEGNQDSDWALWEDSVAFQDSQMQSGFGTLNGPEIRVPSENKPDCNPDPFDSVRRRAP